MQPAETSVDSPEELLQNFLEANPGIKYVRLHWLDYSGKLRARMIPTSRAFQIAQGKGNYSVAQNCLTTPISTSPRCFPLGPEAWYLIPDWTSLRPVTYAVQHCAVMCNITRTVDGEEVKRCPRTLLNNVVRDFETKHESKILVGFEIEWVLLNEKFEVHDPLDRVVDYSSMAGLRGSTLTLVEEILEALQGASISVYHFHTEIADQLELALSPLPPMEAIDTLLIAEEAIRAVSIRHGVRATLTPHPFIDGGPNNGLHMHMSLTPSPSPDQFLAGILNKMKQLCAFGLANYDSYPAMIQNDEAGVFIGWGTENRDFPIRKIEANRWEFRAMDITSNPYLCLAAVLCAGSDGITQDKALTWKDCPLLCEPEDDIRKVADYGVTERLPASLRESLSAARNDPDAARWIGDELLKWYIRTKDIEVEHFETMTDSDRRLKFVTAF